MGRRVVVARASQRVVRRRMRATQRETAIRAAALRIFRRKGYHAASMQEIADGVCLYKASLYDCVASKEELLVQLFEGHAEKVLVRQTIRTANPTV